MTLRRLCVLATLVAGCGRVGFDSEAAPGDAQQGPVDTSGDAAGLTCAGATLPDEWPRGDNVRFRSIGSGAGDIFREGAVTAAAGSDCVEILGNAEIPPEVGTGDRIALGAGTAAEEIAHVLARLSATRLLLQEPAQGNHDGAPFVITRAYQDLPAWESDRQGDLVGEDRIEVGVCYDDGPLTDSLIIDGSTTDAGHFMLLTVAPGARHGGIAGTGVVLDPIVPAHGIAVLDDHARIEWFEITDWSTESENSLDGITIQADRVTVANVIIHDDGHGSALNSDANGITLELSFRTATVRNSLVYNIARAGIAIHGVDGCTMYIENVTALRCVQQDNATSQYGCIALRGTNSTIHARNVIALDSRRADTDFLLFDPSNSWGVSSHNISSDTTAPGPSSRTSVSAAQEFVSPIVGSEDLHLRDGAAAVDSGMNLSTLFAGDVDGAVRTGSWDVGADER